MLSLRRRGRTVFFCSLAGHRRWPRDHPAVPYRMASPRCRAARLPAILAGPAVYRGGFCTLNVGPSKLDPKRMGAIGFGADLCRESGHHASLLLEIPDDVESSDAICIRRGGFQCGQQPKVMEGDLAGEDCTPPGDFDDVSALSCVGVQAASALRVCRTIDGFSWSVVTWFHRFTHPRPAKARNARPASRHHTADRAALAGRSSIGRHCGGCGRRRLRFPSPRHEGPARGDAGRT